MKIKAFIFCIKRIHSFLPKLDELKTIAGITKAAVIGIKEFKVDNSISYSEVEIPGYCILRCDWNRNGQGVACYVRQDLCFNLRSTAMGELKAYFVTKPIFAGIIYRLPNSIIFLECFNKHLDDIKLDNIFAWGFQYESSS